MAMRVYDVHHVASHQCQGQAEPLADLWILSVTIIQSCRGHMLHAPHQPWQEDLVGVRVKRARGDSLWRAKSRLSVSLCLNERFDMVPLCLRPR